MKIIAVSLLAAVVLGMVDTLFFLVGEKTLLDYLFELDFLDETSSRIVSDGISTSCAMFIASYIRHYIKSRTDVLDTPLIEAIGVFSGSILILLCWKLYRIIQTKIRETYINKDGVDEHEKEKQQSKIRPTRTH